MIRFFKALLPHIVLASLGVVVGGLAGLIFDVEVLRGGGMGPAAAHAGAFVLFLLAAVPVLLALMAGYLGLALSLVAMLVWDVGARRWRRRTLVRLLVLIGGAWPWSDLLRSAPPEGGWTILHYVVLLLFSLVTATLGLLFGLIVAKFLPAERTREAALGK